MRILLSTDTVGGVWTYAVELARAMAPLGVEFVFAAMGAPVSPDQRRQVNRLPNAILRERNLKLEWMPDPWNDVRRAGDWLACLEQDLRPDVVHLNGYAHGQWPFSAPTMVVGHSCVLSWWEAVKGERAPRSWARYHSECWAGLRRADLVAAPSHAMMNALQRHYGPLPATRVIHNGVDPAPFRPADPKEPFVFAAGRVWDEAKNIGVLERLADRLPWGICVAGDDRHPDGHRVRPRNLVLLGKQDPASMAGWYGRASVYCLPAKYEPFGLSAVEAGLSGCALVLGDIPSLHEVWGEAAVYVPPNDPAAIAEALNGLIRHPAETRERGRLARLRAERYSATAMARAYLGVYQQLAASTKDTAAQQPTEASPATEGPEVREPTTAESSGEGGALRSSRLPHPGPFPGQVGSAGQVSFPGQSAGTEPRRLEPAGSPAAAAARSTVL